MRCAADGARRACASSSPATPISLPAPTPALAFLGRAVVGVGTASRSSRQRLHPRARRLAVVQGVYGGGSVLAPGIALAVVPRSRGWLGLPRAVSQRGRRRGDRARACSRLRPHRAARPSVTPVSARRRLLPRLAASTGFAAIHAMSFGFSVIVGNWVVTLLEHHGHSKASRPRSARSRCCSASSRASPAARCCAAPRRVALGRREPRRSAVSARSCSRCRCRSPVLVAAAAVVGLAAGVPFAMAFTGARRAARRARGRRRLRQRLGGARHRRRHAARRAHVLAARRRPDRLRRARRPRRARRARDAAVAARPPAVMLTSASPSCPIRRSRAGSS